MRVAAAPEGQVSHMIALTSLPVRLTSDLLALGFQGVAALRQDKPIHTDGALRSGELTLTGGSHWGVDWLDRPGQWQVTARFSRTLGLPLGLPDVDGLALRWHDDDGMHDLVLATTGSSRWGRFLFQPHMGFTATYGCLLPYSSAGGQLMLAVRPAGEDWELVAARPRGDWTVAGRLRLSPPSEQELHDDSPVAFDPVSNPLPQLRWAPAVAGVREAAYAAARRGRGSVLQRT